MRPTNLTSIRRSILSWYKKNKRDLPWRNTDDPYAIWISEVMLQQTQVKTVIPYYQRFLSTLPDLASLDRASMDKVLALWAGLGYYRRARNLKKAARQLITNHGGQFPSSFDEIRALAGIGDYTAGAISSIAFGQPVPAIDGNVKRVMSRAFATQSPTVAREFLGHMMSHSDPGSFNQALMEIGATLCTVNVPNCGSCPIRRLCNFHANGNVGMVRASKSHGVTPIRWPLLLIRRRNKLLLRRRRDDGLLGGLWELPGEPISLQAQPEVTLRKQLNELGLSKRQKLKFKPLGELRHSITRYRLAAPVFLVDLDAGTRLLTTSRSHRWFVAREISKLAVSSLTIKAVGLMG